MGKKKKTIDTPFDRLVAVLTAAGYSVTITKSRKYETRGTGDKAYCVALPRTHDYRFAQVKGKSIEAGFCEPNGGNSYRYLDGKIAADNAECFDKWSKCPLCIDFPANPDQEAKLLELLAHLGSDEGLKLSNFYTYLDEGKNPYHY